MQWWVLIQIIFTTFFQQIDDFGHAENAYEEFIKLQNLRASFIELLNIDLLRALILVIH